MEQKIIEILKDNFKGQNIDKARKELCFLFRVMRSDTPKCPDCGNEDFKTFSTFGNYVDVEGNSGTEYGCDKCHCEFDFDDYA